VSSIVWSLVVLGDMVCTAVFVSQHKSIVNVSTKNKWASGVFV